LAQPAISSPASGPEDVLAAFDTPAVVAVVAALLALLLLQRRALRTARADARNCRHELAQAMRLAGAGRISASIAHEIKQPLSAILSNVGAAELLLARDEVPLDELRRILADIRADDLRAHAVIRSVRTLLERHESERREVDLHAMLADLLIVLTGECRRRGIELVLQPRAANAVVLGDKVQLQQVLLNVVLNAMDAMRTTPAAQRTVVIGTCNHDTWLEVQVSDRGHGFGTRDGESLFESLFTTKKDGMGLGLAIGRSIIEAHGGTIRAAPRSGGGAVFTIRVPQGHPQVVAPPAHARADPAAGATRSAALA